MPVFNNILAGAAGSGGAAGYKIERSLRFNSADSSQLYRTATAGNRQTFTLSWWMKRCVVNESNRRIFGKGLSAQQFSIMHDSNGRLYVYTNLDSPTDTSSIVFAPVYRDPSAWAHYVLAFDSTQATDSDRIKFYYNGVQVTEFEGTPNWPTQNASFKWNNASDTYYIGGIGTYHINAYLAEIHHVDGEQLDYTSFGEFDATTGVWNPIEFTGTHGTNGFYLNFADNSSTTNGSNAGIGKDESGNGNYWNSTNIDPKSSITGFNFDPTSTSFTDIGTGLSVTNVNGTSTVTATSNNFNLTTVADFTYTNTPASDNYLYFATTQTVPTSYTIDYYYRLDNSTQASNASVIDLGGERIRDYGSQTGRTIRLKGTNNVHSDYSYTVSANSWNHVRVSPTGIWINGTQLNSSPTNIGGTSGALTIGSFNNSDGFIINGQVGPVRITPEDLGAPLANGLVANSDGTLTTQSVANSECDSLIDSPTDYEADSGNNGGNHATLNPLINGSSLSNANLHQENSAVVNYATIGVSSGKFYWETEVVTQPTGGLKIGAAQEGASQELGGQSYTWAILAQSNSDNGKTISNNTLSSSSYTTFAVGDIINHAIDMDSGKIWWGKNGTWLNSGNPATGANAFYANLSGTVFPAATAVNGALNWNFGQRPFSISSVPSGYKSICTQNLDDPPIADPSTAFDVETWAGNNSSTNSTPRNVDTFKFSPDLVWIKNQNNTEPHNIYDTVRGEGKYLYPHDVNQENDAGNYGLTGFLSNGFSLLDQGPGYWSVNADTRTYVGWAWDGGDLVTNSDYNQSQAWSNGLVSSTGSYYSGEPATNLFDGNISTSANPSSGSGSSLTFTPPSTLSYTSSVEIYTGGSGTYSFNGGASTSHSATTWTTIASGSGTISSIVVTGSNYPAWRAIRVDGKILVDAGVIPAGSLNSSAYNQSQTWSTNSTMTQATGAFTGSALGSSGNAVYSNTGNVLTSSSLTINSKLEIYTNRPHTGAQNGTKITINGTAYYDKPMAASTGWSEVDLSSATLPLTTTGNILIEDEGGNASGLWSVRVDGKRLVDATASPPNVPTIASTVRANSLSGVSLALYTGSGATGTVAHGLNKKPEVILLKGRNANEKWKVMHVDANDGSDNYYQNVLHLDTDQDFTGTGNTYPWGGVEPTSLTFGVGNISAEANRSGSTSLTNYFAICMTSVEGFSKFGSYTGGGTTYPFVYLGFAPKFLMVKGLADSRSWRIWDSERNSNPNNTTLHADITETETYYGADDIDLLSNGFKMRSGGSFHNSVNITYLYLAFAEHPFKTARAR